MPITIGLNFNHADSSACIFIDNQLKGAIEEERINGDKINVGEVDRGVTCIKGINKNSFIL